MIDDWRLRVEVLDAGCWILDNCNLQLIRGRSVERSETQRLNL